MDSKNLNLEDVAVLPPEKNLELTLDEVGLENVQSQVRVQGLLLPARASATVSLVDKRSRGIHMSRIFKILNRMHEQELSWPSLNEAVEQMLVSHEGLSDAAFLNLTFELPILRQALVSATEGWRNYPVKLSVESKDGQRVMKMETRVLYSSTCPCSASLSRQAIQDEFIKTFREEKITTAHVVEWLGRQSSIAATPHAQRSEAICSFTLDPSFPFPSTIALIDEMENALGTPVQTAVKREDEQQFARLNAQNLMFCEDAARKLKSALLKRADLKDFQIEVRHFESLHPHDVVAKASKND
jgi:GTP cyclohydrolase IB